jgi:dephospho-CoA kinase
MTKIIGLTGGIGSGKTVVAKYMESLGIPVYIADDEAKKVMASSEIIRKITAAFGEAVYNNSILNTKKLAKFVFDDPEKLQKLNNIVHPQVKKHFDAWVEKNKKYPLVVKEAAILFETGGDKYCDAIITVISPLETRIKRIVERDKTDKESVLKRMESQWTDEQRVAKSNYVIHNITLMETYKQTKQILNLLINQ